MKNMADWLAKNQSVKIAVEGYCDERGTTEYNLALGQKRAEAAKGFPRKIGSRREQDKGHLLRQRSARQIGTIPKTPGPRTGATILQFNNKEGSAMRFFPLLLIGLLLFGCASSGEVSQVRQDVTSGLQRADKLISRRRMRA